MKPLLLILLLSLSVFAQKPEYDKFSDKSTASIELSSGQFLTEMHVTFPGQKLVSNGDTVFHLLFAPGRCSYGYCFDDAELIMLIDGERVRVNAKGLSDVAGFIVERSIIEKLAAAKFVEFRVGRYPGEWKAKDLAKIKALLDAVTVK